MLKIKTERKGAELVSVIKDGVEKIHDGVKDWNRHAPILFPIVGKVKDGKTIINGKECLLGQHGFARDMEFEEIGKNSYVLKWNEETLEKYPYKFEFYVSYEVHGNKLTTTFKVKNVDDKDIYFGLGGHPAFQCNYASGKYRIEFEDIEDEIEFYNLKDGLVVPEKLNKKKLITFISVCSLLFILLVMSIIYAFNSSFRAFIDIYIFRKEIIIIVHIL